MVRLTTQEITEMVGGTLHGPGDTEISGVAGLEKAEANELSFVRDERNLTAASKSKAAAIISPALPEGYDGAVILCEDPELAFCKILTRFHEAAFPSPVGLSESAFIASSASLGGGAAVGAGAVIEDHAVIGKDAVIYPLVYVGPGARIGERTVLYPHVCVYDGVEIGAECVIHCNSVIGKSGFGYIQREGRHIRLPHVGKVRIGNRVEIGAFVNVDRALVEETVIEDGVKIDSHSHLSHNTRVGADSLLVAYAKVAGSSKLGKRVLLAEDVGVSDHVSIGDGAVVAARSGVTKDVAPGAVVMGFPPRPIAEERRILALRERLPQMQKRLRALEEEVAALKQQIRARPDAQD